MTLDQTLAEIVEAFDERRCNCKTTLDRVAVLLAERTGRSYPDVRMGHVRGWAARLQQALNSSERRTTVELLDLVIMGPHLQPTWGLLSAIDTAVNEYVRLQQTEEWWATPRYRVVPTRFERLPP